MNKMDLSFAQVAGSLDKKCLSFHILILYLICCIKCQITANKEKPLPRIPAHIGHRIDRCLLLTRSDSSVDICSGTFLCVCVCVCFFVFVFVYVFWSLAMTIIANCDHHKMTRWGPPCPLSMGMVILDIMTILAITSTLAIMTIIR